MRNFRRRAGDRYQGKRSISCASFHSLAQPLAEVPLGGWSTRVQVSPRAGLETSDVENHLTVSKASYQQT